MRCVLAVGRGLPADRNVIETLTVEQVKALPQCKTGLYLNGLTTLSLDATKALPQHEGIPWIDGLATLSDDAAQALAQHKGSFSKTNLSGLSN